MTSSSHTHHPAWQLLQTLLRCPSVTPQEAGTFAILTQILKAKGFTVQQQKFGDTSNLFACRLGKTHNLFHLMFLGHVDVVPPGLPELWDKPAFAGESMGDLLIGRGAVDMKGAIACFCTALDHLGTTHLDQLTLSIFLTSDEEGTGKNGVKKMIPWLQKMRALPFRLIFVVGEPTVLKK